MLSITWNVMLVILHQNKIAKPSFFMFVLFLIRKVLVSKTVVNMKCIQFCWLIIYFRFLFCNWHCNWLFEKHWNFYYLNLKNICKNIAMMLLKPNVSEKTCPNAPKSWFNITKALLLVCTRFMKKLIFYCQYQA